MVFSSLVFLYGFLPVLFLLYFIFNSTLYRNWILIIASFTFYAWGEPIWVLLLIFCAFIGYYFGKLLNKHRGKHYNKYILTVAVTINLSVLIFFKYIDFLLQNLNLLLNSNLPYSGIGLPIGISFFTFQVISYLVDIYRGSISAPTSKVHVLLYISLFPQLIAGPIVRYSDIQHEMDHRTFSLSNFSQGINRFVIGLGKKVILANTAGEIAPLFLDAPSNEISVLGAWFGISLFALQIYFDFSGYSDMAIGLGKMFGFTYPENFNYPYISKSATEFWRRWNMSLGRFFRDYVYIPLGGSRKYYVRNLFIVWFLTGFWHGASWNFMFWGLYFGTLIWMEKKFLFALFNKLPKWFAHVYLTFIMLIGWVFFYFTDMKKGFEFMSSLFGLNNNPFVDLTVEIYFYNNVLFFIAAILISTPLPKWGYQKLLILLPKTLHPGTSDNITVPVFNFVILIMVTTLLVGSTYNPFLYFRF
ncbi:MBOAT family O-acyltransferase [Chengkuizengella axinellae]|uniref:MBOAT family O-acyltransferase n=1 Tax=Chengkuizengella axinellae TaxID=3064388 RepID=A0ABT9J017_9BACL|nr:MBOAT family O-acyltransferase [Chengkuizengella sp. 2205SS18-9]MDP5274971.1 MBOAT family O-acyltransferase [Chengkuizengella sp. 2205SS18-9]